MVRDWQEFIREKNLFKTTYCLGCNQKKVCGKLNSEYCCSCYYENKQESNKEYSSYEKTLTNRQQQQKERFQQLQLLKNYQGCQQCRSLEVAAYPWLKESQLICQPCLIRAKGSSSGPISFSEQSKWYQRRWKIHLKEWLENLSQLPINANCASKWLANPKHLKNCDCLGQESKKIYDLSTSLLEGYQEQLKDCSCATSEKVRVVCLDSEGSGWTYCGKCDTRIESAGHHGVIKNRNSPSFWGLEIKEKVLCLRCLKEFQEKMPAGKKYTFSKYLKRYNF